MLKQISCDQFVVDGHPRGPIYFDEGLNVILGGHSGTNSIGKSTFLMIIDFVFGGTDYVKKDLDVQKNVGPHIIKFAFEFNGKNYYFSRSTEDFQYIYVCNKNFIPKNNKKITVEKYLDFLSKQYNLDFTGLTFRGAVGRFIRVYNRQTTDEKRPLQNSNHEPAKQQVYGLLKLFDKYSPIENREEAAKKAEEAYTAFKNAGIYRYVPIVDTKRQFNENLNKIEQLKQKLSVLQSENNEGSLNLDDMQAARLREIRSDLSQLREHKNTYLSRLNVIKSNEEAGPRRYRNNYHELEQFFPDVDIQRIEKIDKFHHQITKFLKLEFEREKNTIEENVDDLSHRISQLVNEAQEIKNQQGPNIQTALLNEYADKKAELKQLEDENKNYQKKKKLQQDKKDQQDALKATINTELAEVQHSLNTKMASLNEQVCGSSSFQPPRIELKPTRYNFETINDQGTGTSFKGLIVFDQACLDLTRLPFFVHDSLLFSNIEIDRRNRIIEMYAQETKQIFISIDSIEVLSEKAQEIIRENTVLTLERGGKELFGRSWNEQATK